ncbi:hypothetical protein LCGC14_1106860 [marine sediment metagenome]|uniref:KTSC domain-containing protein n=1 Tax=marine sediment metagenome TaxID=412755 RepID=A0A0F9MCK6_9ZZZZ
MARNAAALILARQAKRSKQFKRLAAATKKVGPTIAGTEAFGVSIEELTIESITKPGAQLKVKPIRQVRKVAKKVKRKKRSIKAKIASRPNFTTIVTKVISPRGRQVLPLTDIRGAPAAGQPTSAQNIVLESTAIAAFRYAPNRKILEITFVSGAIYQYHGVDLLTVEKLASPFTRSKGRYFVNNIRNNFGTPTRIR